MMFPRTISAAARLACLVSTLLFAAAAAQAPEKVRLKYASASGDRHVSDGGMDMQFDIQVTAGEQEVPVVKTASSEQEKYTQDVLGVDAKGRPTGIRRAYSVSRKSDTEPGAEAKVRVTSLQGKTVAVRRAGGKVTVTSSGGKLAPEDHKAMLSVLDHPEQEFFPDRDLGPGDEWQVDPKIARTIFKGDSTAQIRCKWEETVEYAGHRCARISVQMDIQGMPADSPGPLTMKLAGSLYHALDLGRMLSIDFAGPIDMTGEKTENGIVYKFKGEGTMRVRETRRWLRVDGKTLDAPVRPDGAQPGPVPARETSSRVLLASGGGQSAEKVRLQYASAVGDRRVSEASMEMELDIQTTVGEREAPAVTITSRRNEKFTEDVLSVDARGRPSGIRRAYSVSRKSDTIPSGETKESVTSLQGRTVAVRRVGGKVIVTSTGGKLHSEDQTRMLSVLEHPDQETLPDRDVGPADTWELIPKLAPALFAVGGSAKIAARFEEIVEHAGHRSARIATALEMKGHPKGSPGPITMKLEGNVYHALDMLRPLSADLAGPVTMTGAKTEKGVRYRMKGEGSMRVRETHRWLRVDGKPVPAAAGPDGAQPGPSPAPGLGGR